MEKKIQDCSNPNISLITFWGPSPETGFWALRAAGIGPGLVV